MKRELLRIKKKLTPYSGVIYFAIILLVCHFAWKFLVLGDDTDRQVTFLGNDISAPFQFMANHVARVTAGVLNFFGFDIQLFPNNLLKQENGFGIRIVWSCTGLKQAYIFFCIIAFYRGPFRKKLWFIPLGLVVVYLFNLFRIAAITALVQQHSDWFTFLHEYFFKYLFYAVIFALWVWWEEKFATVKEKNKN
jgi:exosortase/archaeosortase family protein